jgi:hypothetical protein
MRGFFLYLYFKSKAMRFPEAFNLVLEGAAILRECWDSEECIHVISGNLDMTKHTRENVNGVATSFFDLGDAFTVTRMPEVRKVCKDGTVQIWTPTNQDLLASDWIQKQEEYM